MDARTTKLAEMISRLLEERSYAEVLRLPEDVANEKEFVNGSWDLIPVIIEKINDNTLVVTPALYYTCEKLLNTIVDKANAEEVLLELIERVESAKNDAQFLLTLGPLRRVLDRLISKRNRSLEWCLNSISTYIETVPIPDHNLEGRERVLMDSDENVRRIEKMYAHLPEFYSCFLNEVLRNPTESSQHTKKIIVAFLIGLLGKPIIYIDVNPEESEKSEARICCQHIVSDICKLQKDILKLLEYVGIKYKDKSKSEGEEIDPYLNKDKLLITSLGGLLYMVFSGDFEIPDINLPNVYRTEYIVHTSMLAVIHLLSFRSYAPITKGLKLCKALLAKLSKPVSSTLLSAPVHFDLCKSLVNIAVFSTFEKIRKDAVQMIGLYVNMFDYKGRSALVKCLLDMANHSGMIGYAITLYKNSIDEVFKSGKEFPECFTGVQFMSMIKKFTLLPHGAESDLVELADQIITTLNFIRYLALKDTTNITGIKESFGYLETNYIDKLRTGLYMSKAHYELKLKDIEEEKKSPGENVEVSVNVGGNVLDDIPVESRKQVIQSALNAFHLMEGLVARVCECINMSKSFEAKSS